jgi:AraC-like DNA-binding protein/mannose-6-phosphate isomerase-like protein (cupin superfamily)
MTTFTITKFYIEHHRKEGYVMHDYLLYEKIEAMNKNFPVKVVPGSLSSPGDIFSPHWHEHIELIYFSDGKAQITCDENFFNVEGGSLIIVNSAELHSAKNLSTMLNYYTIFIDISLLQKNNSLNPCESKYINPIAQNLILFKNDLTEDQELIQCIKSMILESNTQQIGYELSIISSIYLTLTLLLRNHVSTFLTHKDYEEKMKNSERFSDVLDYIDKSYTDDITIEELASIANMSMFYFCRLFKKVIGQTPTEYITLARINKAEYLLKHTNDSVSNIAMYTGFNDISYFSRQFKKYKGLSPSQYRKSFIKPAKT